jgi:RNA polymerase sigma-70 factor (ECF subfamily)
MARSHAEDLVQETFLAVHRSRQTYLPGRPVKPWVLAIARYVFLQDRRAAVRRRQLETSCAVPDVLLPEELRRLADRDVIATALGRLAPDRRESVLLHHALGLSFPEIGQLLGVRAGTAKLRAYRGMSELREILGQAADR